MKIFSFCGTGGEIEKNYSKSDAKPDAKGGWHLTNNFPVKN
jgi:hypothetical protein